MFHKNRIAGGYESEKRSRASQLNSTQAELNRLNQEKNSVQNQIYNTERELSRVQSENNWNKMLEENARKQKEQQAKQQIKNHSLPIKQAAPAPLASPETIKNDLTDEQIIQILKAHRKPTPAPTTLFGKKTGFEKIELPQKTKNEANIEVFTNNHFYPEAKITFAEKETSRKHRISYIKKQIIPLKREGRENQ